MIMYILLAGKHPIYEAGDALAQYLTKLKTSAWTFPPQFSALAQHLFAMLAKVNPLERYTAKEALSHPWITRRPGPIPLSFTESAAWENAKTKLINVSAPQHRG